MLLYRDAILDAAGNAIAGASVAVTFAVDSSVPTLYADQAGASALASNVVTTSVSGEFSFYIATGVYTLTISIGGSIVKTVFGITIGDVDHEWANVADFLKPGFNTANQANVIITTAAFNAAIATGKRVYAPAGTYVVQGVNLLSNTFIHGDGAATVIQQLDAPVGYAFVFGANIGNGGTTSVAGNIKNVTLRDLKFYRAARTAYGSSGDAWQFQHLVSLSAASSVLIDNCQFVGMQGDGLYIGSTNDGTAERHNQDITIRNCLFDGIDGQNRNGISAIDCDRLLIEGNTFANVSNQYQPGAIDIEPDGNVYHVLRDITIRGNKCRANGGSNGSISIYLQNAAWTTQPSGFLIEGNDIDGGAGKTDFGIFFQHAGNATSARNHALRIVNNKVIRTKQGFRLFGASNLLLCGNHFDDTVASPLLSFSDAVRKCFNVRIEANTFANIANDNTSGGSGLSIFDVDYLDLVGNTFVDCGKANGTFGYCIDFNTGTSSYVGLMGNRFLNPGAKSTVAIQKEAGHTFTRATNRYYNNDIVAAGANNFDAEDSNIIESTYTPIAEGATAAGAGTYNTQFGRYTRNGKRVQGELFIDVQAGHTGTGIIELSLPVAAKSQAQQIVANGCVFTDGLTGGDITALLNTGASAGGITGALRLFTNNSAGASTGIVMPAGAFTARVSFDYMAA